MAHAKQCCHLAKILRNSVPFPLIFKRSKCLQLTSYLCFKLGKCFTDFLFTNILIFFVVLLIFVLFLSSNCFYFWSSCRTSLIRPLRATSAPQRVETGNVARWLNEPEKIQHFITTTSMKMGLAFSFEWVFRGARSPQFSMLLSLFFFMIR